MAPAKKRIHAEHSSSYGIAGISICSYQYLGGQLAHMVHDTKRKDESLQSDSGLQAI